MKHLLSILAFTGLFATTNAQTSATTTAAEDVPVEHTCTAACAGEAHAYLHGQKGHTCTTACTAAATAEPKAAGCCAGKKSSASCAKGAGKGDVKAESHAHASKEHACTTACADGKHTYACGEKGHECGATCQHMH